MPIASISSIQSDDAYYTEDFKTLVRSNKENIIANSFKVAVVDMEFLYAFKTSQYQFLRSQNVDPKYWWTCSYINGWKKPTFDIQRISSWLRPNEDYIDNMLARNNTERS